MAGSWNIAPVTGAELNEAVVMNRQFANRGCLLDGNPMKFW